MSDDDGSSRFTPSRTQIVLDLVKRDWFQNSSKPIQEELMTLPMTGKENHDGFLQDLANRPESMGGITVIRLERLARGNFGLIPIFLVKNQEGTEYTYEYFSWRQGPISGAKGIIFVRSEGVVTHFIVLRGDKFAMGGPAWDTVGGFADLDAQNVKTVLDRFKVEIQEELGLSDIQVDEVVPFGSSVIDAGMTNNQPLFFAAFIDGSEASRLSTNPQNPDEYELRAGALIIPIEQLTEMVKKNTDNYFRSLIALALVHGLISLRI